MSTSAARPEPALVSAARFSRVGAAAGFAALSLFVLGEVAFDFAHARQGQGDDAAPPPRPLSALAAGPAPAGADPAGPTPADSGPLPPLSPRQILIDLGPPRSEVFVDGRRVGRTPFVGQVLCRPGREISIHVVPDRGFPIEEQRVCPP